MDTLARPASGGSEGFASALTTPSNPPGMVELRATYGADITRKIVARSLRILMIATEAPPVRSGIARTVGYLRDGFQQHGHSVDVLAYPEVRRVDFGRVRLSGLIIKIPQLVRHIDQYDVIHIHGSTPTISDVALIFARILSRLRDPHAIVIYTHHNDLDLGAGDVLSAGYNYIHHRLSAGADAVIAGTRDILNLVSDGSRGLVIPYGIDLERFSTNRRKDEMFTIAFVGQFRPYKGVRVLLQAMSQVAGARLIVAGQGPEEQTYRDLADELGLKVEFHVGEGDDELCQIYQRAHVITMPSVARVEAFGLTLVEGMAAGCVPVASNLPGVREVVGQTGFLFRAGDANHLAGILRGLRDDPVLVQQLTERARVHATAYSREREISAYESLISGLVESRDLRHHVADLVKHVETPSLLASRDARNRVVDEVEYEREEMQ